MRIYVASSWRNAYQPQVVQRLRAAGHEVYDFRNPTPGNVGFHWSEIDPAWQTWDTRSYVNGLTHPLAHEGYQTDIAAIERSEAIVLVLPCGRSAHLEFGYAIGRGMRGLILIPGPRIEPELMYSMAHRVCDSVHDVVEWCNAHLPPAEGG